MLTVLIGTTATILQFYAILSNYVPIMESIKKVNWAVEFSFFRKDFFNEKITKPKILGVIFLSIGVYFIV